MARHTHTEFERCARCTRAIEDGRYALSRLDNESHLCSSCGQDEGLWNTLLPNTPLPPLGEMAAYWTETGA